MLKEYQSFVKKLSFYPKQICIEMRQELVPFVYPALGLVGEAGEVAEKIKKYIRDGGYPKELEEDIKKELGDVLFYVTALAIEFGLTLEEIMQANMDKLNSRKERGKLSGSGDDR